jgi:hypothetical protein
MKGKLLNKQTKTPRDFIDVLTVNAKLKTRSKIADLLTKDGEGISEDGEKASERARVV